MPGTDPNSSKFSLILDIIILIICILLISLISCLMIFCAYEPRAIIFLAAWMPKQHYTYFPVGFLAFLFHGYLLICLGFNMCVSGCLFTIYLYCITMFYTKELVLGHSRYKTLKVLRSNSENLRTIFRAFQLLHSNVMCILGIFLVYLHSVFMVVPIFGNFLLITYWDDLHLLEKTSIGITVWGGFLFWASVLEFCKYVWVRSHKILWSWNGVGWGKAKETKIMKLFRKSCKPVLIRNGNMLVMGRITQLKYLKGVVRGLFRSLLTLV